MTVSGPGGQTTCSTTVTVVPPPPTCTLSASPTTVIEGNASTLSWTTTNATSFSINNGIGAVTPVAAGSRSATPSTTTTYTGTATGAGGTVHCATEVTFTTPPPAPTCTLSANPTTITQGDSSTLTWTTTHAKSLFVNNGVGYLTPVADGTTSVSPTSSITYTGTAVGYDGTTVHCGTTVNVVKTPLPKCTLTASPTTITLGGTSKLTWIVTDANALSIDQGIGSVTPVHTGSVIVSPKSTTTYTGTATTNDGKSVTCVATVTVTILPPPPTCTLTANPSSIHPGDSTTLSWTTTNGTSFSIDNGIGAVTPVDSGSATAAPSTTTTYTGTVTGPGGTATCKTKVTITTGPTCSLSASPTQVNSGDHAILSWATTNADTFSIDQGIGAVTPAVSGTTTTKAITADTTFTGTAISPTGQVVTCTTVVTVGGGGGGGGPTCTMTVSPSSIRSGNSATLTWGGSEIANVDIDNGIATATSSPGSTVVAPTAVGTHTYTGTFHATNGQTLTCSATLNIEGGSGGCTSNCGGGGSTPPTVSLFSHPTEQPLAYLYLSQIPYTGLDLGTWGTMLYWIALVGWSLALAYLILFGAAPFVGNRARKFGTRVALALNETSAPAPLPVREQKMSVPAPRPVAPVPEAPRGYSTYEGFKSFAHEGVLSVEDIVKGLSRSAATRPASVRTEPIRDNVEPVYDRVEPIYSNVEPVRDNVEPIYKNVEPVYDSVESIAPVQRAARAPGRAVASVASVPTEVPAFLEVIIAGNRERAFAMLRDTVRAGGDAEAFLTQVACALDDAYRSRIEGVPVHPDVERICKDCATPVLEKLVTSFASAVDSSYSVGITGAKLALTRALATLGA